MKRVDRRLVAALAAPGLLLAAFGLGGGAWLWATLDEPERATLAAVLQTRGMLLVMVALALWALAAWALNRLYHAHVLAAAQLLEQARSRAGADVAKDIESAGSVPLRGLALAPPTVTIHPCSPWPDFPNHLADALNPCCQSS